MKRCLFERILLLFSISLMVGCGVRNAPDADLPGKADDPDLIRMHLNGPVRSVQINAMETVFNSQGYISEVNRYNEEGKLLSKEIRNYQQSGALSEAAVYVVDGRLDYRTVYEYDERGLRTGIRSLDASDQLISREAFTYNREGRMQEALRYRSGDTLESRTVYAYAADGTLKGSELFRGDGRLGERMERKPTEDGGFREVIRAYANGRVSMTRTRVFNQRGEQTEVLTVFSGRGRARTYRMLSEYEYDARGNWTRRTQIIGGKPQYSVVRTIVYFDAGADTNAPR